MILYSLDFFSSSPNSYIFHRSSNKTNFGGVCFLLSILIIIGISIYLIIEYIQQDTYALEYISYTIDYSGAYSDSNISKPIKFEYEIYPDNIQDHFALFDCFTGNKIPNNTNISKPISEFCYYVLYECQDDTCEIREDIPQNTFRIFFTFEVEKFNLQDENPISSKIFMEGLYMTTYELRIYNYFFQEIMCTDIGFFGDKNSSIIVPKSCYFNTFRLNETDSDIDDKKFKLIGQINFSLKPINWERYKRTKKSFWATLSYICSIGSTIYSAVQTGFLLLYSKNFDNYKIIHNLLHNEDPKLKTNKKITKEMKQLSSSDFLLSTPPDYDNINNYEKDEQKIENEKTKITQEEEQTDDSDINFPKLSFISYIFNNFYFKNCCNMKNQTIISKCNEIISKYYSIENILYNQILMENLMKDYKWNDPKLKKIERNELINNLKIFIKNNYYNLNE